VAQKFHFEFLRIEVTRASRGLSAIGELLVAIVIVTVLSLEHFRVIMHFYFRKTFNRTQSVTL